MGDFPHRRLEAYTLAVRAAAAVYLASRGLPPTAWPIGKQAVRASSSIVLNIAEGAGEYRPAEKARFYRMARRSAAETAAAVDLLMEIGALPSGGAARLSKQLDQIGAVLTKMAKTQESRRSGHLPRGSIRP